MLLYEAKSIACLWNQFQAVDKKGDDASYRKKKSSWLKKKKKFFTRACKMLLGAPEWEQRQPNHALAQM